MTAQRDLVQRARSEGPRSTELTDPTPAVTSPGDRGAGSACGVIYPLQVAIIGFSGIVTRPWVCGDAVLSCPVVVVTLAADHRASDGHVGGRLLAATDRARRYPSTP